MKLLAIDSSTKVAGAALMEDGVLVCELNLSSGLTHSQRLMDIVHQCLTLSGWQANELDVVGVVCGPGSFTGVRIGVATAKGIADALGCPVAPVNTLETLAQGLWASQSLILPLLDARRGQVYAGGYRFEGGELMEVISPCALPLAELLEHPEVSAASSIIVTGDGVAPNLELLNRPEILRAPGYANAQRSGVAAELAYRNILDGKGIPAARLTPFYIRSSQAEQTREAKRHGHS